MAAGDLLASSNLDPANILQGGVGSSSRLVLILQTDMASYTVTGIDTITAITLAANKSAFSFEGIRQSLKPKYQAVKAESGQMVFKHMIDFLYFEYTQTSKNNAARIAQGRYVCVYENAKQDANTIEVMGIDVGLEMKDMTRAPQEMGGAHKISLESPDKEFEAKPPHTWDGGTGVYATNRALVDAMLFLPTIGVGGLSIVTYPAATPTAIVITGTNFFGADANNAVLAVSLINQATGAIIPFTATPTVTATTITTTTPVAVSANTYKVKVLTKKGFVLSAQNIVTT